jgi:hypothetical protein
MSREGEGRRGLALAALMAGVFALILLISVSSPAVAGTGSGSGGSSGSGSSFKLQASGNATLGDATVTVRATSGSIVHTLDLPISVADQLPSC